jgi:hypothetical protein
MYLKNVPSVFEKNVCSEAFGGKMVARGRKQKACLLK